MRTPGLSIHEFSDYRLCNGAPARRFIPPRRLFKSLPSVLVLVGSAGAEGGL